jgi:hypothetical protein
VPKFENIHSDDHSDLVLHEDENDQNNLVVIDDDMMIYCVLNTAATVI